VYPAFHYEITPDEPYNLYIDINTHSDDEKCKEAKKRLFDALMVRIRELRHKYPNVNARVYTGCLPEERDKLNFYISQGFREDDGAYIYQLDLNNAAIGEISLGELVIVENKFESKGKEDDFIEIHNSIFAKKLDHELMTDFRNNEYWTNFSIYADERILANIMVYAKENESGEKVGFIENLYVARELRGRGIGKKLMKRAFEYFLDKGLTKSELEVWKRNRYAVKLYESLGYKVVKETEIYPGLNL
jgi:ribosomal protein S18 acetylase RimI-like enzyme